MPHPAVVARLRADVPTGRMRRSSPRYGTTCVLHRQVQVLQAAVTGLTPKQSYVLALSTDPNGTGTLEPLEPFMTNQAGSAIVNTVGPIRQIVQGQDNMTRRYLVIVPGTAQRLGPPVQILQAQ